MRSHGPWQIAATALPESAKPRTTGYRPGIGARRRSGLMRPRQDEGVVSVDDVTSTATILPNP